MITWVMIAVIANSLVVSGHETKEACEGRAAIVHEQAKVEAKCVEAPGKGYFTGTVILSPQSCGLLNCNTYK